MTGALTRRALLGAFAALLVVRPKPTEPSYAFTSGAADAIQLGNPDRRFTIVPAAQRWVLCVFDKESVAPGDVVRYAINGREYAVVATTPGIVRGMWVPFNEDDEPFLEYEWLGILITRGAHT